MSVVTLLLVNMLLHLTAGICLVAVGRSFRAGAALSLWGVSNLIYALGFCLLFWRVAPGAEIYVNLVGNLLLDVGTMVAFISLHHFLGCSRRDLWPLVPAAALSLGKVGFMLAVEFNFPLNVILGCLSRAVLACAGSWLLIRRAEPVLRSASWTVAAFQLLWAALLLFRVVWELAHILDPDAIMSGPLRDPSSGISLLLRTIITFAMTMGYLWMIGRRLEVRLIRQAQEDPLTGIANRRALWEKGERLLTRAVPSSSVLVIDIDHFKSVNDQWGHGVGDQLLVAVAKTIGGGLRPGDILARIGGEEFAVLLPGADANIAAMVAERVRAAVADLRIESDTTIISCTVSIGHASLTPGQSWEGLVKAADDGLYSAKRAGRNRVVAAVTSVPLLHPA